MQGFARPDPVPMTLFALGLNHQTAPLAIREKVSIATEALSRAVGELTRARPVKEAAILVDFQYEEGDAGAFTPVLRNIFIDSLTCAKGEYAILIHAYKRSPVTNFVLTNSTFTNIAKPNVFDCVANVTTPATSSITTPTRTATAPPNECPITTTRCAPASAAN